MHIAHEPITVKRVQTGIYAWMLISIVLSFISHVSSWILVPVVLGGVIAIIGSLLALLLNIKTETVTEYGVYSFGLGLAYMLLGGLVINTVLPFVGIDQPLAKVPLLVFFMGSILAMLQYAVSRDAVFEIETYPAQSRTEDIVFGLVPVVFVLLSVLGSTVLNNGGTGLVSVVMLVGVVVYVLLLFTWGKDVEEWVYVSALYCIGLALLLAYSLRTTHVLGWDIHQEYQVFQTTLQNLRWSMSDYPGLDYNACLSITILPTIFAVLTHVPSEYVFKVLFQILFAVAPVIVYVIARKFLKKDLAFLAAFLLLSQTWFYEQMPAIIRQETAFLFFLILLLNQFDTKQSRRTYCTIFIVATLSLIVSHYSTSYILILLVLGSLVAGYFARYLTISRHMFSKSYAILLFAIPLFFLFIWGVPITRTGSAITNYTNRLVSMVFPVEEAKVNTPAVTAPGTQGDVVQNNATAENIPSAPQEIVESDSVISDFDESKQVKQPKAEAVPLSRVIIKNTTNSQENLIQARASAIKKYTVAIRDFMYPDSYTSDYVLQAVGDAQPIGDAGMFVRLVQLIIKVCTALLIGAFPLIGVWILRNRIKENQSDILFDLLCIGLSSFALVGFMIVVPYAQEYYNVTRLYLQVLFVLSIVSIIGGYSVLSRIGKGSTKVLIIGVVILFCAQSGLLDTVLQKQPRITLSQPPSTFDDYIVHAEEIASVEWLMQNRNKDVNIQADILANLRLQSIGNINSENLALFPQTLDTRNYVFMSTSNVRKGHAFFQYKDAVLTYNYPTEYIGSHKNLIYNNGGSRVYK